MVKACLESGKHVFVEKPLAINQEQLEMVIEAQQKNPNQFVTVGFNRRFAPLVLKAKQLLGEQQTPALNIVATMNAGFIDESVWVQDMQVGGGRIIGEACHFIDLMTYLTGSLVQSVHMSALGNNPSDHTDNAIITLKFVNGSQGVINYFSNGNKAYPKERIEIHSQGKTIVVDNFRKIEAFGYKGFAKSSGTQDKGHKAQFKLLVNTIKEGSKAPISFEEIVNTTRASFAAIESLKTGKVVKL
jgi:predicted dehydrogenase